MQKRWPEHKTHVGVKGQLYLGIELFLLTDLVPMISVFSVVLEAAFQTHLSFEATGIMPELFRRIHPDLPRDLRNLLESQWHTVKKTVGTGKYIYFGLERCMRRAMEIYVMTFSGDIKIQLKVDGVSLFCGSAQQLRPIPARMLQHSVILGTSSSLLPLHSGAHRGQNVRNCFSSITAPYFFRKNYFHKHRTQHQQSSTGIIRQNDS